MGVFFSIIIPVYNGEQYIKNCLDSIYRQGLGDDDFEVICVNDCSTDNTAQVISEYGKFHQNLRLINHETNRRQGGARNTGVKVAEGDYILYIDADDTFESNALPLLKKELEKTKTELTDMAEFQQMSAFDQPIDMVQQDGDNVGKFEMTGIDKKTYTEDMFSEYDLTLVNVFTTWCSPCVNEIPELEKLYQELKDQGVGVTGVVLDTADSEGNQDEQAIKKAELLQEKTKATYPFLIPDKNMMNGRLQGISAFPETFFVDKNGNIVGETYSGSHTLEEWKEIVEKELSAIKENN